MIQNATTLVILLATCLLRASVCSAQDYAEAVGNVPQAVRALKFGTTVADIQRAIPDAKPFGAATSARSALFVYFKPPDAWDGAMLDFVGGRLEAIHLLIGTNNTPDMMQRSVNLLSGFVTRNGAPDTRLIALNSSKQPVPAYVWSKDDYALIAIGPSVGFAVGGQQIFPPDPQMSIGVARKGRPLEQMVQVASSTDIRDLLFKALSPVGEK